MKTTEQVRTELAALNLSTEEMAAALANLETLISDSNRFSEEADEKGDEATAQFWTDRAWNFRVERQELAKLFHEAA